MTRIAIIHRSRHRACGIFQFCKHLAIELRSREIDAETCNLKNECKSGLSPVVLVQYVPSMWAGHAYAFDRMLSAVSRSKVVVMMHGLYGPGDLCHRLETPCNDLPQHLASISKYADSVIALSESCRLTYELWFQYGVQPRRLTTLLHPGVYGAPPRGAAEADYVFFGGIMRPKKGFDESLRSLLAAYSAAGQKVWVHAANGQVKNYSGLAWRISTGLCSDGEWSEMLGGAAVVICPYNTRIQCVSGVIAETLSVGTRVLATNFPFAREMRCRYPDYVAIEDDLSEWPELTRHFKQQPIAPLEYMDWRLFTENLLRELVTSPASDRLSYGVPLL